MRVTLLGSGTAVPSAERFPAGVLVEAGDETIVVDLGPGVLRRLAAAGVSPDRVTTVLLTHYHPDHCADLVAFFFALRNPAFAGRGPLRVLGGTGLHRLLAALRDAWPRCLEAGDYECEEREIGAGTFGLAGVEVSAQQVEHAPESLAYRIRDAATGAACAVSGDADEIAGVVAAARGADLLICEAAFPEAHARRRHLTAREAGHAAALAAVRLLCLTHLYPREWEGHDPCAEAREAFGGTVVVGDDLLAFELAGRGAEIVVRQAPAGP